MNNGCLSRPRAHAVPTPSHGPPTSQARSPNSSPRRCVARRSPRAARRTRRGPTLTDARTRPQDRTHEKKQTSPEQAFELWRQKHAKPEHASPSERTARLAAFRANAAFVAQHNRAAAAAAAAGQKNGGAPPPPPPSSAEPARLELNAYADLTWDEFRRTRLGFAAAQANNGGKPAPLSALSAPPASSRLPGFDHAGRSPPKSVDWRAAGAVSPVGNQGACGSCYAWSATGAIEGINAIATGASSAPALSVQEILDCDTAGEDSGCGGGLMDSVFDFVAANGGVDTVADYSYYSAWGLPLSWCNRRKMADRTVVAIDGHQGVPPFDEAALAKAVSAQPVAVAVCASPAMQFYAGGVMGARDCCEELNHGVLLVGYEEKGGSWIVKNSWGGGWGEGGYFRLQRVSSGPAGGGGSNGNGGNDEEGGAADTTPAFAPAFAPAPSATRGLCGITTQSSYPLKRTPLNPSVPSSCDALAWAECPAAQTCGCNWRLSLFGGFFPFCVRHDCCPHPGGVDSCGDGAHCCPGDRPVCDPGRGVCLPEAAAAAGGADGGGGGNGAVPWLTKLPANYSWGWTEQQERETAPSVASAARRLVAREAVAAS